MPLLKSPVRRKVTPKPAVTVTVVRSGDPTLSLVKEDGVVLGFIEKYQDTATDTHPYKAFEAILGQGPVRVKPGSMKPFYGLTGFAEAVDYLRRRETDMPSWTALNENTEFTEQERARLDALAKKWTALTKARENESYDRISRMEDQGRYPGDHLDPDDFDSEADYNKAVADWKASVAAREAEKDLELEIVEEKLSRAGVRMMRAYEHWNEDERYMEYMENRPDY
ncbi:unnamed protein product [Sphagnum tenellum]